MPTQPAHPTSPPSERLITRVAIRTLSGLVLLIAAILLGLVFVTGIIHIGAAVHSKETRHTHGHPNSTPR